MKYIKAVVLLILVAWIATAPVANKARPGSLMYRLAVTVNEPVWVWMHITNPGRAETVEGQLDKRYWDLEQAWESGESWQVEWAVKAEKMTAQRVMRQLQRVEKNGDHKTADSLAGHAVAITRAHKQVLSTLVAKPDFPKYGEDIFFMDSRLDALGQMRQRILQNFAKAYDRAGLVRGIDDKLIALDLAVSGAAERLAQNKSQLLDTQHAALEQTIAYAGSLQGQAKTHVGTDQYVEAFRVATDAEGYAHEAVTVIAASKEFGVTVMPSAVPN